MRPTLFDLWNTGVDAVRGAQSVRQSLSETPIPAPTQIIAVGKAACDMAHAAQTAFPGTPTLIATKHGHAAPLPDPATIHEAGHPIPDAASLEAGHALAECVSQCHSDAHLLMLVSGGASAVAELLPDGLSLEGWQAETQRLMAKGADIHEINTRRREISQIKGGKLLGKFAGQRVTTLAISDVDGDSLNVIGSGIGNTPPGQSFEFDARIVASNHIARQAIERAAGPCVVNVEALYDDVNALAPKLADQIKNGPQGLYIIGGEPTVLLPEKPGRGGRNQALALLLAGEIQGHSDIEILVAGTDGTDGPTPDAGGLVNGETWGDGAADALRRADAGTYLAAQNALITTGPTGTNVMDILIARKG